MYILKTKKKNIVEIIKLAHFGLGTFLTTPFTTHEEVAL